MVFWSGADAALVDSWRASDFSGALNNGDSVANWTSTGGRALTATSASGLRPRFYLNVTPAGGPVVRFDQDRLQRTDNSPVAGLTSFSIALVFRLNGNGVGGETQWYNNTGLVDAEQGGVTADWGIGVTADGRIGWGVGQPDQTLYTSGTPSLVDSNFHAAVFTWGGGEQAVNLDNQFSMVVPNGSFVPRNNAGLAFGRLLTDVNQALIGELVEVRFYDAKLSSVEANNVVQELRDLHIAPGNPVITTFAASTNQIVINSSVTLSWNVINATTVNIQPAVGNAAASGSVIVSPRTNTTYTLTASNAVAVRTEQLTVLVDQLRPTANNQSVSTTLNQSKAITLTGSDPQGSNLTYTVLSEPTHGTRSGTPPNLTYTPATGYIGNDQFTFKVDDGEFDSAPATVSIQVLAPPTAPSDITISTTNINTGAGPGSFIATLKAIDINPTDTHTFTLAPGFGDNARFVISSNVLFASQIFVGTNFTIRVRATDSGSLWIERTFNLSITTLARSIVINEIHYNPDNNTVREEFIELYNPIATPLDLSNWELSGGVDYTFPPGTVIAPHGFLVIAQDPATIQSRYGVTALGPWSGALASEGEEIQLENAAGDNIDRVDYNSEFPWPISASGQGASAALVNPELDNDLGSSWRSATPPTPGATNNVFALNAAPNIRQVNHTPESPTSTNQIIITAKVTDPQGVGSVQLQYQLVTPGNYLPVMLPVPINQLIANTSLTPTINPAYTNAANWTTLPMRDNGTAGDAVAGDDIYTAVLPAQGNRVLVRYRIIVTDTLGASRRAPFEDDLAMNFGCYVYDGIPAYQGTSSAVLQSLPVYTLLTRAQDVAECTAYNGAYQIPQFYGAYGHPGRQAFNWPGTLIYDGQVYENIHYRLRGANGRYQPGKRNWRFEMNRGNYFAARDQFGQKFPRKWQHITTGKGSNNRLGLTFGLNEVVNYFLWNKVGVPAPETLYFHFRVVDGVQEAPDQYNGDFWGLNWAQEDYDAAFLDNHGMEKGNLYKLINAAFTNNLAADMVEQRRYQGPFAVTNGMDGAAIQNGLLANQTEDWIRARVNCEAWYRYHAVCEAVRHYDFWPDANKNAAWYFEPPYNASNGFYGRFWTLPWDTDSTWGATWNSGQDLVYNGIFLAGSHPQLQRDYRNVVREIRDLLFQPDQINPVIDAHAARIAAFVPADLARWSNAPASGGNYVSMVAGAGFATPAHTSGIAGQVADMKEFMFTGGSHPWWIDRQTIGAGGWITRLDTVASDASIPSKPVIYYVGQSNFPMNSLTFECLPFSDPQGAGTFAGMQWRLAEVRNTNQPPADLRVVPPLEWDAVWESGTLATWNNRITIPGVVVETNKIYRARVRHLDNTGRWSKWSAPLEFTPAAVDLISVLRQNLRFSEIMYNPPAFGAYGSDDLEFLELQNIGATTLDLSGLTFSAGITFTFANGTSLAAGQRFLMARNAAGIAARYPGTTIQGIYTGRLDNGGETLRISTPLGVTILEVDYKDSPPWPVTADGMGWSLVLADAVAGTYRVSTAAGGSPGAGDAASSIPPIVISELLTHTDAPLIDAFELFNPTAETVNIGGWFLSDDADLPKKFRIPTGTTIPAAGYRVFLQTQYDTNGLDLNLNSLGDKAYLFAADEAGNLNGYVHGATFGAAENGVSFGRYVNSPGLEDFVAMSARTLGTNNSRPLVGPVVISEIMFQPPLLGGSENFEAEFIELQNVTATNVPLFATDFPTNTWRLGNAVDYFFPTNTVLPAEGRLLVVSFDPQVNPAALAAFRSAYGLSTNVPIFGPWSGRLNNDGESIELKFPDEPEADGFVPYVMVEKVSYKPTAPWPSSAAGTGQSLQRATLLAYGNDPINWFVAAPTAGELSPQTSGDVDGDGVPDVWEMIHGTEVFVADGTADADGDGFNNYSEWMAGTNPQDAASYLKLEAIPAGGSINLRFEAKAKRSYSLLKAGAPDSGFWFSVTNVPAASSDRVISVPQSTSGMQFFRVTTPAQP
ncbi:MAG TPA: lamin tail domain-containing protein [Verrucomicrobiae bacterium]|nr:lamin tail domain-containing protein [Verrucomicrobiae bacterium]